MAYSAWSVVAFEQPTTAKWNLLGSNDADFNTRLGTIEAEIPLFMFAYLNVQQDNLVTGTPTLVNLDTEVTDDGNDFNTTTHLYTVPSDGLYLVNAKISYTSVVTDKRYSAIIYVNGAEAAQTIFHASHAQRAVVPVVYLAEFNSGDTVGLYGFTDAGVNTVDIDDGITLTTLQIAALRLYNV